MYKSVVAPLPGPTSIFSLSPSLLRSLHFTTSGRGGGSGHIEYLMLNLVVL